MTYDQWFVDHKPIVNPYLSEGDFHAYKGRMFETYGPEVVLVSLVEEHHVWTLIDGEDTMVIVAGRHFVNRLGYFVTVEPWKHEHMEVLVD